MSYYKLPINKRDETGIDYDLYACLEYNGQDGFDVDDIKKVLAVIEGENDGPAWHWVLWLKDGRFIYLTGSCDYTGWDCQSGAEHVVLSEDNTLMDVAKNQYMTPDDAEDLMRQIREGKNKTWRETMDKEFDIYEMAEKILAIEEVHDVETSISDFWQCLYEGYKITTDKQEILIVIDQEHNCCESWGYMTSDDDLSKFTGAKLLGLELVGFDRAVIDVGELDCGDAIFVNAKTSRGVLQFAVYNAHNGYYGHTVRVISKQLNTEATV